jgi:PAS domain S-box-containing protein
LKEGFGSVVSGEKAANEYRFITKSGDIRWMRTSSSPVFEGEKVVAVHGVILDITDRRQAEEALRESEERYSNLFHSSNDAIFVHDLEGNIRDVNRKVLDLFGYSREEVSKLQIGDLHPPRVLEVSRDEFRRIKTDGHVSFEIEFKKKSGDIFPAEVSASILEIGGEKLIMGIVRDRSGKKHAEDLSLIRRDLGRTLSSIGDRKGALRAILGAALKIDGLDGGGIYFFDDRTGELILEDHSGLPDDFVRLISRHAPDSPNAAMVRAGKPIYDHYDKIRPEYVGSHVSDSHFRAIAMIPFEFEGVVLGVINLTSFTQDEMPEITRLTLEAIATEVGSVLARINAQESVLRSEALLSETQRLTRIGGWEYDVETERVVWTEEMYNIHELPPDSDNDLMSAGLQCYPPEDRAKVETALGRAVERGEPYDLELRFITAKDNHRWIRTTAKAMSRDGRVTRVVGSLMDITERKQAEMEMRRRLMGFDLRDGNLYLVKERTPTKSILAFENLLKVGYSGTIISRTPPSKFKGGLKYPFEILWISDKGDEGVLRPFSDDITAWVESLERGHAILMDRLDFLVARKGVKSTIMLIQSLSELAYVKDHIIILSIDPATLEEKELRLVEKEAQSIEPYVESKIPDEYFELIQYVYQQNISGVRPSYSELGGQLGASKPTVRKRVRHLIYEGYLKESAKGRTKVLEVTEKGRRPFTT